MAQIHCQIKLSNIILSPSIVMISCQSLKPLPYMYVKILPGCLVMQKKVYKFQKLGFEILETQETLLKKHELKLKYANNIIQNQEDHNIPELSHLTDCGLKYSVLNEPSFFNIKYKTKNTI